MRKASTHSPPHFIGGFRRTERAVPIRQQSPPTSLLALICVLRHKPPKNTLRKRSPDHTIGRWKAEKRTHCDISFNPIDPWHRSYLIPSRPCVTLRPQTRHPETCT